MNGAYDLWRRPGIVTLGLAVLVLGLIRLSFFAVDAREYAVVTAFGNPVQVITEPGLRLKWPYHRVTRFDNRLFVHSPSLSEFLTLEKTPVVASSAIVWRVADPHKFFRTVFDRRGAESRLSDILFGELGAAIGKAELSAFVSYDPEAYRAESILSVVAANCRTLAARDYGIDVVDVRLTRLDFPRRNRLSVYSRMKSERVQMSMRYRSEGEEEGLKIRADAQQKKAEILAEAFKVAEQLRGEGEAEAARIYAESLGRAPDFYRFLRAREAARKVLDQDTTMLLPADSALFGLLYDSNYYNKNAPGEITVDRDRPGNFADIQGEEEPPLMSE